MKQFLFGTRLQGIETALILNFRRYDSSGVFLCPGSFLSILKFIMAWFSGKGEERKNILKNLIPK